MTYPDGVTLEHRYDDEAVDARTRLRTLRCPTRVVTRDNNYALLAPRN
jgi:hypothetical protein